MVQARGSLDQDLDTLSLVDALPKAHNSQGWARLKPGARISPGSPMWVAGVQVLGPSSAASPRLSAGIWMRSKAARTWTSTHVGCWSCRGSFSCYATTRGSLRPS